MDSFSKNGSAVFVSEDNPLPVTATVDVGDVEIGAVEIKDGTAATRAAVLTTPPGAADPGLVTRIAGSVTISDGSGPVTVDGTITSTDARPATSVLASVAASVSSVVLRAANAARLGLTIFNDSTAILYLAFAATATTSAYTVKIGPGDYYELPRPVYTGDISGIWSAANGNARVTAVTA